VVPGDTAPDPFGFFPSEYVHDVSSLKQTPEEPHIFEAHAGRTAVGFGASLRTDLRESGPTEELDTATRFVV
jgi:hypothetical protein